MAIRRAIHRGSIDALATKGALTSDLKDWAHEIRHGGNEAAARAKLQRRMVVTKPIKNVVLVHGAFADGSGWEPVANLLKNEGYNVSVAQPPETSYADDQKYTRRQSTPWAGQ